MEQGTLGERPAVSVVVPVGGGGGAMEEALENAGRLRLGPDDEVILADNTRAGTVLEAGPARGFRVVDARGRQSSYRARNTGAAIASGAWILFLDVDCRPSPGLVDEYFSQPVPERCGALAGAVRPSEGSETLLARYARSRRYLDQRAFLAGCSGRPFAATANLMVRRAAWEELGGFCEVRSGGDVDFCWRLQDSGWSLELREAAFVEHRHRESLRSLLRQRARYAAGHRWLDRRHPGGMPRLRVGRGLARTALEGLAATIRGDGEEARFRTLDALVLMAHAVGRIKANAGADR